MNLIRSPGDLATPLLLMALLSTALVASGERDAAVAAAADATRHELARETAPTAIFASTAAGTVLAFVGAVADLAVEELARR